jgi:lysophospholipase L1-like esterase
MIGFDRDSVIRPGLFGENCAADSRRGEFDFQNESLLAQEVRPDVLFIGDSITHFWEVQAYFGGKGRVLINRGIGGDISVNVLRRFEADALQLKPGLIVMLIGTNDLGWDVDALGVDQTDAVCENSAAIADSAKAAGIPIAIGSILPIWGPPWCPEEFTTLKNARIAAANPRIKRIAEQRGAIYVDYHTPFLGDNGEMRRELAIDGVHPHCDGYAVMADTLRDALANADVTI